MASYSSYKGELEAAITALGPLLFATRDVIVAPRLSLVGHVEVAAQGVDQGVSGNVSYQLALTRIYLAYKGLPYGQNGSLIILADTVEQVQDPSFFLDLPSVYAITDQDIDVGAPVIYGNVVEQLIELVVALTP